MFFSATVKIGIRPSQHKQTHTKGLKRHMLLIRAGWRGCSVMSTAA